MRIRVKHAVDEHHLAVRAKNSVGERGAIDSLLLQLREIRDFGPVHKLGREHTLGRQLSHHDWKMNFGIAGEVGLDGRDVPRLTGEVELFADEL
jgi:hypothetical protein